MDIKILDSWLRDHLKTEAKPDEIARALSLTSASIERLEPYKHGDIIYHVEVTTNRPDLASVIGLAREAGAILPRFEIPAEFIPVKQVTPVIPNINKQTFSIHNDSKLVTRICAVILEVEIGKSPKLIEDRLEASGTRSLNNLIDITNYTMHEMGHPTHVFDYDRLKTKEFFIRESKKGERIVTLDNKEHILFGGDIVADDGTGQIIDLLGVMGLANSVITNQTKRILFFIDNNEPRHIRKTSMTLSIRTEAAGLNEKDVDPELAFPTLLEGISLYQKYAKAKIVSDIFDIYPQKVPKKTIAVSKKKITSLVGILIPIKQSINILHSLGFQVLEEEERLVVTVPSWRERDIIIEEDVIEEIARVFGYHNIPSELPSFTIAPPYNQETNLFFWENRIKDAMKYWGFTETYTYSMVSKELQDIKEDTITIANPLDEDHMYMRTSLIPSLQTIAKENKIRKIIKIFEISNVYKKKQNSLPDEIYTFTALWREENITFYHMKGLVEQITIDCGIKSIHFEDLINGDLGAEIYIGKTILGFIKLLEPFCYSFELNFEILKKHATLKTTYTPMTKFPPVFEDIALVINKRYKTGDITAEIKKQSSLITSVTLLDQFDNTRTFHIVYQNPERNLTSKEIIAIREQILHAVFLHFQAIPKI